MVFVGDVATNYARHRRGFPPPVMDLLVQALGLPREAYVLDLGCGTGQLTVPLAGRFDRVLGADPEPDMLGLARAGALAAGVTGIGWLLAADTDVGELPVLAGLDAVTISNAIHFVDAPALFAALAARMSDRGRIAIIANSTPLWLQDSAWSRALRAHLEEWLGVVLGATCGTDPASRHGYRRHLAANGFPTTDEVHFEEADPLPFERVVGNVYSAMPADRLPTAAQRPDFEARLGAALHSVAPGGRFVEDVRVSILVGARPAG